VGAVVVGVTGAGWKLTSGPHLSVRGREERRYRFERGFLGRRPDLEMGQKVAPRPFSYFFDSLFVFFFLDYFITFSFLLQIDSNQFLKFAKIRSNNLGQ
jgi:hypothetical protein